MLADMMSFCWHNWMGPIAVCGTLPSFRISYNYLFGDPKWNWVITVNIIILFTIKDGIRKNAIAFPKLGQTVCNRAISHWPTAAASSSQQSKKKKRRALRCPCRSVVNSRSVLKMEEDGRQAGTGDGLGWDATATEAVVLRPTLVNALWLRKYIVGLLFLSCASLVIITHHQEWYGRRVVFWAWLT